MKEILRDALPKRGIYITYSREDGKCNLFNPRQQLSNDRWLVCSNLLVLVNSVNLHDTGVPLEELVAQLARQSLANGDFVSVIIGLKNEYDHIEITSPMK